MIEFQTSRSRAEDSTRGSLNITEIHNPAGLDKIEVFWRDYEESIGSVTITCWGSAWTAWFGGLGKATIQEFFFGADVEYLVNKLTDVRLQKDRKADRVYLGRIVRAIKAELEKVG